MKILGFVGTAKNTGKTTTALHILDLVSAAGIRTALTSIGYDGENKDHVTGLPKPRYFAQPGLIIATAQRCLEYGTAQYVDVRPTGLHTILGEVVIATVSEPGTVVVAGPNRKPDIQRMLDLLRGMSAELTMLDGALNRLAPMVLANGMVLSTGAAFDERVPVIAAHAAAMESLFQASNNGAALPGSKPATLVGYANGVGWREQLPLGSILDPGAMETVAGWFLDSGPGECIIPGACDPGLFQQLIARIQPVLGGSRFVFTSPVNLIASGDPLVWQESFATLAQNGCAVAYTTPTPLCFLTVNPFYPQYLQKTGQYIPAFVDKTELLAATRATVQRTAVVDILQPPHPDLLALCGLKS